MFSYIIYKYINVLLYIYVIYVYVCIGIQMCVLMNSYKRWILAKQITLTSTTC